MSFHIQVKGKEENHESESDEEDVQRDDSKVDDMKHPLFTVEYKNLMETVAPKVLNKVRLTNQEFMDVGGLEPGKKNGKDGYYAKNLPKQKGEYKWKPTWGAFREPIRIHIRQICGITTASKLRSQNDKMNKMYRKTGDKVKENKNGKIEEHIECMQCRQSFEKQNEFLLHFAKKCLKKYY